MSKIEKKSSARQTSETESKKSGRQPLVTIVVPAYNEADVLEKNLEVLWDYLQTLITEFRFEILIVNDGSTDATGDIAEAFAGRKTDVYVLHHMFNFRLGQALRLAFHRSQGDIVVVIDADLSYAPVHIGLMLAKMKETRAKIVIASPYRKGGKVSHVPLFRRLLSSWANRFLCLMAPRDFFSDKLTNITGMVRAYDGEFVRRLSLWAMDVDINPEIINKAKILRARIVEVPAHLNWEKGKKGPGRTKRRKSSLRVMRSIIQSVVSGYMFRPFHFFIFPGLVLFFLSLYPLVWTIIHSVDQFKKLTNSGLSFDYRLSEAIGAAYKLSPHSFIVGGFALMVAIQLISLGLLALQKKRYFAELFHLTSTIHKDCLTDEKDRISMTDPLRKL
jgi:glycosyltransferase involved in cell wall biosynthesis